MSPSESVFVQRAKSISPLNAHLKIRPLLLDFVAMTMTMAMLGFWLLHSLSISRAPNQPTCVISSTAVIAVAVALAVDVDVACTIDRTSTFSWMIIVEIIIR
mmetsp:Transcript_4454/g.2692  ORF Transcript_4454/g.2692 Transcript_4454/m.2692 type:complete len:102 (-) Transcript_4454:16-321(-)